MTTADEAKEAVDQIRLKIEACRGSRVWLDYVNSLKLISQVVFTRSSGFILELLQNAEDAGHDLVGTGAFEVHIGKRRVKVVHNGREFTEQDVESICGIRSSKKPEAGTLGYLGIGFKSVYKVSDSPEVYSGPFQFKFDRSEWPEPATTPWQVIPIWLESPSEPIDRSKTTFVIPFRERALREEVTAETSGFTTSLFLFLKWIRVISSRDEVGRADWLLEHLPSGDGDFEILSSNGQEERFKLLRRTVEVDRAPADVREDRLTHEYRANVKRREISIAFLIDSDGNLAPQLGHAMYGGVYSFLPLGEARSGVRFPIQADFLVQPGRDAINYQAPWNRWLLDEVFELCKEAIGEFKVHPDWRFQYLQAFQFVKTPGLESYDHFFGPRLIEPLEKYLQSCDSVPTEGGGWGSLSSALVLEEGDDARRSLTDSSLFNLDELGAAFGGSAGLRVADPRVRDGDTLRLRRVDRLDLLSNSELLAAKAKDPHAPTWFRNLYLWLAHNPRTLPVARRARRVLEGYWTSPAILTAESELDTGGNVWLLDFDPPDPTVSDLVIGMSRSKKILHPEILSGAKDSGERELLRGFLTGRMGVQLLDAATVCKEAVLPRISTRSPPPKEDLLISLTQYCEGVLGDTVGSEEIWVMSKDGEAPCRSRELVFPPRYRPPHDWESNSRFVPGIRFLSEKYLGTNLTDESVERWGRFFRKVGVKEAPDNGVRDFGQNYVRYVLEREFGGLQREAAPQVTPVDSLNYGYDHLVVNGGSGRNIHVEVKGLTADDDVTLSPNETESADTYQEQYFVCVVSGIPERPAPHFVRNPAAPGVGKKDKLTIPVRTWRERGTPTIRADPR